MKTLLPKSIATVEEAKRFLTDLYNNDEEFHPEDNAHDIVWNLEDNQIPTFAECEVLNRLMEDIYGLPENKGKRGDEIGFCPCGFLLELDPDYVAMRDADEKEYAEQYK